MGCKDCGKKTYNSRELGKQMRSAHKTEAEYIKCHHCQFMSYDGNEVERHKISENHNKNNKLECPICNTELPSDARLVEHINSMHGDMNASVESLPGDNGIKVKYDETAEDEFDLPPQYATNVTLSDSEETAIVTYKSIQKSMLFGKAAGNLGKIMKKHATIEISQTKLEVVSVVKNDIKLTDEADIEVTNE